MVVSLKYRPGCKVSKHTTVCSIIIISVNKYTVNFFLLFSFSILRAFSQDIHICWLTRLHSPFI